MDCHEICTDIFYSMNTADFRMMCDSKDSLELNFGPVQRLMWKVETGITQTERNIKTLI